MEQLKEAQQRVKAAGLSDHITLLYCDYRELQTDRPFDALISCEMIEAVGHENLPVFFSSMSSLLKPGAVAVLQVTYLLAVCPLCSVCSHMPVNAFFICK